MARKKHLILFLMDDLKYIVPSHLQVSLINLSLPELMSVEAAIVILELLGSSKSSILNLIQFLTGGSVQGCAVPYLTKTTEISLCF